MTAPARAVKRATKSVAKRTSPRKVTPAPEPERYDERQVSAANRQDIRLAVVLNGGVSLAVWISGVVLELHRLVQGSRSTGEERAGDTYADLLDLLDATARIDVIAGTSAGGLNGGFLSLGLVHGCDLEEMRRMWREQGDLAALLRDPRHTGAPSLLRGQYFFDRLTDAYNDVFATRGAGHAAPVLDGEPQEPVELYLTGTLWRGRRTPFADDMGRSMVEVDYDATFQFSSRPEIVTRGKAGDLEDPGVVDQLAVASRCTSSFPGAFEPFEVTVGKERFDERWASTAGLANFEQTQYVVDGGVLLNKPIRPAIEAVYRQSADVQVRRLLAYVVPDPAEQKDEDGGDKAGAKAEEVPRAHEVLLGVLTRLRSTDSVAAELAEVERRNEDVRQRRRTRDRLARALLTVASEPPGTPPGTADLVGASYAAYREVRKDSAARTIGRLMVKGAPEKGWSRREVTAMLRELSSSGEGFQFVPPDNLTAALVADPAQWRWGQSAVNRLGDVTLDVLRRAVWLAPNGSQERAAVVAARLSVHGVLADIRADRRSLNDYWEKRGAKLPERGRGIVAGEPELAELREALRSALRGWEGASEEDHLDRRRKLHGQAYGLAQQLAKAAERLRAIAAERGGDDPWPAERGRFADLVRVLLGSDEPDDVLRCMLRLEVLQVAFAGVSPEPEQEVELVQVSSQDKALLTGVQEHHFGAFYRASWRVNDWMRGRLDGATQLVQMLLAPERLRQCGICDVDTAVAALRTVAVGPVAGRHHDALVRLWDRHEARVRVELGLLTDPRGPLPRTFPLCAELIAARLHAEILEKELDELAGAVDTEADSLEASENWARTVREAPREGGLMPLHALGRLEQTSQVIGRQRVRDELLTGSDTFARTSSHGVAAFTALLSVLTKQKQVSWVLSALRGYALLVWLLTGTLTSRSRFGTHAVSVAVGAGGALLALALLVPGLPAVVPLVGAVVVLAAASASALARRTAIDAPPWIRLGLALLVAVIALLGYLVLTARGREAEEGQHLLEQMWDVVSGGLGKVAIAAAVIGLGWWLAGAKAPTRPPRQVVWRRNRRMALLLAAVAAVVAIGLLMVPDGRTMNEQRGDDGVSYGIVDFELAGRDDVQQVLDAWGEQGRDAARRQIVIDYPWLVAYATVLTLACLLLGGWLGGRWDSAGRAGAAAAVLAGACDAMENTALLVVLGGGDTAWAQAAKGFARTKFTLLFAVGLFLLAALGWAAVRLWRSPPAPTSA